VRPSLWTEPLWGEIWQGGVIECGRREAAAIRGEIRRRLRAANPGRSH
jgi:hypothetical protein